MAIIIIIIIFIGTCTSTTNVIPEVKIASKHHLVCDLLSVHFLLNYLYCNKFTLLLPVQVIYNTTCIVDHNQVIRIKIIIY